MKFIKCSERLPAVGKRVLFKTNQGFYFSGHAEVGMHMDENSEEQMDDFIITDFPRIDFCFSDIDSWSNLPEEAE